MGELVELRDLIAAPGEVSPEEFGTHFGVLARMFEVDGERVVVRWRELWTGPQSRSVARADVEGVSVEPDDRSAAGGRTWKVVVRLRGGDTILPVRRDRRNKEALEAGVAKVQRALGLAASAAGGPVFIPTSLEDLPGTRYAAAAESGEGMRPIVEGPCTTLIATDGDGAGVRIRLGRGRLGFWSGRIRGGSGRTRWGCRRSGARGIARWGWSGCGRGSTGCGRCRP